MMVGALAAISSTADSALIAMSQMVTEDLFQKTLKPDASAQQVKVVSSVLSVITVVVSILFGTAKSFNISFAMSLQTDISVLTLLPYVWGLFPDFLTGTPSTRSQIYGLSVGILVVVGLGIYNAVTVVDFGLSAGIWGLIVNLSVVGCMEKFCDPAYLDDDKRTYDLPPEYALSHLVRQRISPAAETTQAADTVNITSTSASADKVHNSSNSDLQDMEKSTTVGSTSHNDFARLSDEYLSAIAALNMNEPFADFAHSEPWELTNLFASPAAPSTSTPLAGPKKRKTAIISNRSTFMLTMGMMVIFLPWFNPGGDAAFAGGWPVWALILTGSMLAANISTMLLICGWRTPPDVSNKHKLLVDTLTNVRAGNQPATKDIELIGIETRSPMQSA
jgi:hypothetical protein